MVHKTNNNQLPLIPEAARFFWFAFYLRLALFASVLPLIAFFIVELAQSTVTPRANFVLLIPGGRLLLFLVFGIPAGRFMLTVVAEFIPFVGLPLLGLYDLLVIPFYGFLRDLFHTPRMWFAKNMEEGLCSPDLKRRSRAAAEIVVIILMVIASGLCWSKLYLTWLVEQ